MKNTADILLKNAVIVTVDNENTIYENGDIALKDGKIFDIGKDLSIEAKKSENLMGAIIIPGLINTHTHAAMTLFRGLADDLPLMEWLNNHIFPAESFLNPEYVHIGSLLACLEMLKSGTTCFCDMYFFEDEVAKAAQIAGIKVFAGEAVMNFKTPSSENAYQALETTAFLCEKYKNDPLVNICTAPHSTYLTDEKYLLEAKELSIKNNIPFVIHTSESASEIHQVKEKTGKTPIRFLNDAGLLDEKTLCVHCVCVDEEEIKIFKDKNVKISHNPESNMKLASGIAPVPEFLNEKICVSIGTDGAASNNDLCMLSEMDTVAKLHKVNKLDPTVLSAREVLRMATIDGAKALGIEDKTGSLEKGKDADLVILNRNFPGLTPLYNPESHIVYSASRREIKDVYIKGKKEVGDSKILNTDTNSVIKEINLIAEKIWTSIEAK